MQTRKFHTIDALRGVAALAVVTRHTPDPFFHRWLPSSYLAVDLFFVLSGFVLAHVYGEKLGSTVGFGSFMLQRVIRLWPLYLLGCAMQVLFFLTGVSDWPAPAWTIALAAGFALLLLPIPPNPAQAMFPINGLSWSLFWEIVANGFYALVARHLNDRRLAVVLAVGAVLLAVCTVMFGKLDVGFKWNNAVAGLARVLWSFFAGVAVYRLWSRGWWRPSTAAWFLPLLLLAIFVGDAYFRTRVLYDLVMTLFAFPLMVLFAASSEPGRRSYQTFKQLGVASYAIYILQLPVVALSQAGLRAFRVAPDLGAIGTWGTLLVLVITTIAALAADRWFDVPVRKWLRDRSRGWLVGGRSRPAFPVPAEP